METLGPQVTLQVQVQVQKGHGRIKIGGTPQVQKGHWNKEWPGARMRCFK